MISSEILNGELQFVYNLYYYGKNRVSNAVKLQLHRNHYYLFLKISYTVCCMGLVNWFEYIAFSKILCYRKNAQNPYIIMHEKKIYKLNY